MIPIPFYRSLLINKNSWANQIIFTFGYLKRKYIVGWNQRETNDERCLVRLAALVGVDRWNFWSIFIKCISSAPTKPVKWSPNVQLCGFWNGKRTRQNRKPVSHRPSRLISCSIRVSHGRFSYVKPFRFL